VRGDTLHGCFPRNLKAVFCWKPRPKMNEVPQLATAMLAIVFAAVMLVAGQLYIEKRSAMLPAAPAALKSCRTSQAAFARPQVALCAVRER